MASYKPVTAALRVLEVLAGVNRLGSRANVAEIHHLTGIDKATVVRMLDTLIAAGYVLRDRNQAIYRPTGKTLSLGTAYDRHRIVSDIISDDLADFRQQIGWPSDVALFDHDAMLVVQSSRAGEPLHFKRASGFRAPVLATSLGLAYIANCPTHEREEYLVRAAADPAVWNDLARNRPLLEEKLEMVRRQRYATMEESYSRSYYESKFFSIGVPIMTAERIFGAINVIYLRSALTQKAARDELLEPIQDVAASMAQKLAGSAAL
ncbi:IclR family transcriptional regulator [Brucellaceae bacterium VT-16-1752]|nr:IclR family transcriptional regulator [Brucellaceae bacterium VT-16-1752]